MRTFLIGGGWSPHCRNQIWGPFLSSGPASPTVACVVLDEGDGQAQFERWAGALRQTSRCTPQPVLVPVGGRLELAALAGADALLVCGGLTPAYAAAVGPVADDLHDWLASGRPFAGFSAGASCASGEAIVGGWRLADRRVCPEDAAEGLDQVTTAPGLGLVPFAVDVHAAQWGTVSRGLAAVQAGVLPAVVALDEDTVLIDGELVEGIGQAWCIVAGLRGTVQVRAVASGQRLPTEILPVMPR